MSVLIHIPELLAALRLPLAVGVVALTQSGCAAWAAVSLLLIVALHIAGTHVAYNLDLITQEGLIVVRAADILIQVALALALSGGDMGLLWALLAIAVAEGLALLVQRIRRKREPGAAEWGFALWRYLILFVYCVWPGSGSAIVPIALVGAALATVTILAIGRKGYGRTHAWR